MILTNRIGEIHINKRGEKVIIINYVDANNVFVQFENGEICKRSYGNIVKKDFMRDSIRNRIGKKALTNEDYVAEIIKYKNCEDIDVLIDNKYIVNTKYGLFKTGQIHNIYHRGTCGVGFLGNGIYKSRENGVATKQYGRWLGMLQRCYDENFHKKNPTYKDCTTYDEWHNFQNFEKWDNENYYEIENEQMHLDKDILIKGNKIYGPDTCVFVPSAINMLFIKGDNRRGLYPIGTCFDKNKNNFMAYMNKAGKRYYLGRYPTQEEAFYVYKTEKEKYIKEVADEYKNKIPQKLYAALYKYEVEIND